MANLVSCNMCGRVLPYQDTYFAKFYRRTDPNKGNCDGTALDLCQACRDRLVPVDSLEDYDREVDKTALLTTDKVFVEEGGKP